jgi:hypothetical protein
MSIQLITKRGYQSALYACPMTAAAASRPRTMRAHAGAVSPFQGTGLPFAGTRVVTTDSSARIQLDPTHPGSSRRPPS